MNAPAPARPAVFVDDVSKSFRLPRERVHTLKERVLHPFRRQTYDTLDALRNVSLEVRPGEFYGIVGRNGSGKSTLLKCLAGIYRTDQGQIYVDGRVSTFIELGVGFNPDLAARDNVLINATMLGLPAAEARQRFAAIIEFAELEEFIDLKIKNYSSGMLVRLAFSVMIQVDADILLIDEVLAVGDAAFQQKCFEEFERIRADGKTVLLVTHDMSAVRRFCDRALLLEHGKVVALGDPERIGNRYLELNFSEHARAEEEEAAAGIGPAELVMHDDERSGDGRAEIVSAWFEEEGVRAETLQVGRECAFVAQVRFDADVENPIFGLELVNSARQVLLAASTLPTDPRPGTFPGGQEATFRVSFPNYLAPDRYHVSVYIEQGGHRTIVRRDRMFSIPVTTTWPSGAVAELPCNVSVERAGAASTATAGSP